MSKDDLVIVVDEQDREIAQVPRWQAERDVLRYRITGVWLENSQGQVLIAQRGLNRTISPGLWGPAAAGTVEVGQSYHDNAVQEVREELGIDKITLDEVTAYAYSYATHRRYLTWFRGTTDMPIEDMTIEFPEVNAVAWVNKRELFTDIAQNPQKYLKSAQDYHKYFSD